MGFYAFVVLLKVYHENKLIDASLLDHFKAYNSSCFDLRIGHFIEINFIKMIEEDQSDNGVELCNHFKNRIETLHNYYTPDCKFEFEVDDLKL